MGCDAGPPVDPLSLRHPTHLDLYPLPLSLSLSPSVALSLSPSPFTAAAKVGVSSGHRLGFWLAVPAVLVGMSGAVRRGFYRYMGYLDNGTGSIYPGYEENSSAPYFVTHSVSDRHFSVSKDAHVDKGVRMQ